MSFPTQPSTSGSTKRHYFGLHCPVLVYRSERTAGTDVGVAAVCARAAKFQAEAVQNVKLLRARPAVHVAPHIPMQKFRLEAYTTLNSDESGPDCLYLIVQLPQ